MRIKTRLLKYSRKFRIADYDMVEIGGESLLQFDSRDFLKYRIDLEKDIDEEFQKLKIQVEFEIKKRLEESQYAKNN